MLFLDLRTETPRMSWSSFLYRPTMEAPLDASTNHLWLMPYEMQRTYYKSLFLFLSFSSFLSFFISFCEIKPYAFVKICLYTFIKTHLFRLIASTHDYTCHVASIQWRMNVRNGLYNMLCHKDGKNLSNCFDIIRYIMVILLIKRTVSQRNNFYYCYSFTWDILNNFRLHNVIV